MAAKLDPAKLTPEELARVLGQAGGKKVSVQAVRETIQRGAPTNRDGSLHLVHYTAWLAAQAD